MTPYAVTVIGTWVAGLVLVVGVVILLMLTMTGNGPLVNRASGPTDYVPPLAKACPPPSADGPRPSRQVGQRPQGYARIVDVLEQIRGSRHHGEPTPLLRAAEICHREQREGHEGRRREHRGRWTTAHGDLGESPVSESSVLDG